MALGFQLTAFQNDAFQNGGAVVAPRPGAGGTVGRGRVKRKPYVIDGRQVSLSREELEETLEALLIESREAEVAEVAPKVAGKDRGIVAAFPAYPDVRDMLIAARQIEAAQVLRALAVRLADEEDERDVEVLLLWG